MNNPDLNATVTSEIDRYIDRWYARQDFTDVRDPEVEWLNRCEQKRLITLNRPPLSKQKENQIA